MKSEATDHQEHLGRETAEESDADFKEAAFREEEVVVARLTDEDMFTLSAESLRFWSWTGFKIVLIMIVQGEQHTPQT